MKKILSSLAIFALSFVAIDAAIAAGKSVIIVNNNATPVSITYSTCDEQGTFCEFTKTKKLGVGEKLLIK